MKLASYKDGRDGRLVVVSKDLKSCVIPSGGATTMQALLDDWEKLSGHLVDTYDKLNDGRIEGAPFDQTSCASPLPRAFQWADGSAYINHVELVRKARGAEVPDSFYQDPLMYQGGSDTFLGPRDDIVMATEDWGIDLEGEVAVITGDVPMGTGSDRAGDHVRLVMLVNDVSLRGLIPGELGKGFGFFQSKPSSAFSPVAVTPDELGEMWDGEKLTGALNVDLNGKAFGRADAGTEMTFAFPKLIAHAAKSRPLGAGTIIGSGTVSNKMDGGPGKPVAEGGVGYSCLAEQRMIETIQHGEAKTPFLRFGDRVKIWMDDPAGRSVFGEIEQTVAKYDGP